MISFGIGVYAIAVSLISSLYWVMKQYCNKDSNLVAGWKECASTSAACPSAHPRAHRQILEI